MSILLNNSLTIIEGFIPPQLDKSKYVFILIALACWIAYAANSYYFVNDIGDTTILHTVITMDILFFSIMEV